MMSAAALKGRGEHTTVGVAAGISTIRSTASGAAVAGGERLVTCSKLVSARPCRLHLRWTPESQQGSDKETVVRGEGRLTIGILNLVGPRASGGGGWWMLAAIRGIRIFSIVRVPRLAWRGNSRPRNSPRENFWTSFFLGAGDGC